MLAPVFVRSFVEIDSPYPDVLRVSRTMQPDWVRRELAATDVRVRQLLGEFKLAVVNGPTGNLTVSAWRATDRSARLHASWTLDHWSEPPSVDAEVEIAAVGERETQLSISGQYQVPETWHGDTDLLHRLAERVAAEVVDHLRAELVTDPATGV